MVKFNIKDLNIWFGSIQALKDVNLEIQANEILSIIGPANSGKTTFLRMLNRLNELEVNFRMRGMVELDGKDISSQDNRIIAQKNRDGFCFAFALAIICL